MQDDGLHVDVGVASGGTACVPARDSVAAPRAARFANGAVRERAAPVASHRTTGGRSTARILWQRMCIHARRGDLHMIWTIIVILLILWVVGLVTKVAVGAALHILLVIALILFVIQLISGRRRV
jgi:hypothetical protein